MTSSVQAHTETSTSSPENVRDFRRKRWPRSAASMPRPLGVSRRAPTPAPCQHSWGMGIRGAARHHCLIALSLVTGRAGRPGTGCTSVNAKTDASRSMQTPRHAVELEVLWCARRSRPSFRGTPSIPSAASPWSRPDGRCVQRRRQARGMSWREPGNVGSRMSSMRQSDALAARDISAVQDSFDRNRALRRCCSAPASAWLRRSARSPTPTGRCRGRKRAVSLAGLFDDFIAEIAKRLGLDWRHIPRTGAEICLRHAVACYHHPEPFERESSR